MNHAIRIYDNGGPEILKWERFEPGDPDKGEVLVRHKAVGLNFIDLNALIKVCTKLLLYAAAPLFDLVGRRLMKNNNKTRISQITWN